tara:strand:- start:1412 stop:2590 length:1179 start_codon:yes stop_codon:yes gene_type:complete
MQIIIGNTIRGQRYASAPVPTPFAKLQNQLWTGGVSGLFSFDLYLKESDDSTSLITGDPVELVFKDGSTVIESIEGFIGNDISTFTAVSGSPTPASSFTNWSSGTVQDGGTIQFTKKQWADANSLNYNSGSLTGSDWSSAAIQLTLEVFATDLTTGEKSSNADNSMIIERVVDLIEGNVFTQYTITSGGRDLIYSATDNDSLTINYVVPGAYEKYKNGVLLTSFNPAFSPGNFSWGSRYLAYQSRNDLNGYMLQKLAFSNGMNAENQIYVTSPANAQAHIAYDRQFVGTQIADTFPPRPESDVSSTLIQRAMRNGDNITPSSPLGPIDIYINGVFDKSVVAVSTGVNSSEANWFDLDMTSIGKRNTVKFETTMTVSNYIVYNQFQIELNYVY